ncbi:MAG: hypothetical protein L0Y44_07670, partial [Phycisphaerales bacterium]|nr:hypothetical protein [Phycisphaerales bacterium]
MDGLDQRRAIADPLDDGLVLGAADNFRGRLRPHLRRLDELLKEPIEALVGAFELLDGNLGAFHGIDQTIDGLMLTLRLVADREEINARERAADDRPLDAEM